MAWIEPNATDACCVQWPELGSDGQAPGPSALGHRGGDRPLQWKSDHWAEMQHGDRSPMHR